MATGRMLFRWAPALLAMNALPAAAMEASISASPEIVTGTYGSPSRTTLFQTPVRLKVWNESYGFGVRLPFLYETGTQAVVPDLGPVGPNRDERFSRSGLGNLRLAGWTTVWRHAPSGLALDLAAEVALPAIENVQSMGVGFTRLEVRADISMPLAKDWWIDTSVGRRFIIGAPGLNLNPYWFTSIELGHDLGDRWTIAVNLDAQQRSSEFNTAVLEIGPRVEYELAKDWRVGAFVYRGFTRDSAEYGGGISVTHRFSF